MLQSDNPAFSFVFGLSDTDLRLLFAFVTRLEERVSGLNELPLSEMEERLWMNEQQIENASLLLREVQKIADGAVDTSMGIAQARVGAIKRKKNDNNIVFITGLQSIPFAKLNEIFEKDEIKKRLTSGANAFYESFDNERGLLRFAGEEILLSKTIGKENNAVRMMSTLAKDPTRYWHEDEVAADWEGANWEEIAVRIPRTRFYEAAASVCQSVAIKTGIDDFLEFTTKKYRINPAYLNLSD